MQKIYKQFYIRLNKTLLLGVILQCFVTIPSNAWGLDTNRYSIESLNKEDQDRTIKGTVTFSEDGTPMPGVNVLVKGTLVGTTSDTDGKYSLTVPDENSILTFSFIGYVTQEILVGAQSVIEVAMVPDTKQLGEVVVVGYGMQEKVSLTGSVSNIKGDEMLRTKNENPQNMLTGRVAGVRVWQKSAEPGTFNASLDIRGLGSPLIVIDGIQRTMADFQRLNPSDIEELSVLKDASAAIYGARAANGVVLITTKKGSKDGKATVTYNGSYTLQSPAGFPELSDPYQTMTLYNEMAMNNINGGNLIYQQDDFEAFQTGRRRTTDWNSLLINEYAPQNQHDISITGGTEKTQYYIAGGYMYQEGFFKSGDMNYSKVNLRSNITTEIAKGLKLNLNLNGVADQRNSPYSSAVDIIRNYWRQGVLFPAYADPENTMLNYEGLDLEQNTVAMMSADVSGYRKYKQKYFQSSASLEYDFGTLTHVLEGFTTKGLISYDYRGDDNDIYRREYYQYMYDQVTDSYQSKLYNNSSPNQIRRELFSKQQILAQFLLNYKRTFATKHDVSGLLGFETQNRKGDNFYAQRDLAFAMEYLAGGMNENQQGGMQGGSGDLYEIANSAMFGRLNYGYNDRYIAEVQFRYDGSSKFVKTNRWGWFPSASVGWRLSEEPFFKSISALSFVDQFKIRASYGMTADDGSLAYDWYPGYIYPATSGNSQQGYYNQYAPGYMFNGEFIYGASVVVPNENITWWTAKTFDIGVDFEAWRGKFGFSVDYFDRRRDGLFSTRSGDVPSVVGTGAPRENTNSDRQFGIDLELSHRNTLGELSYGLKGIATITRRQHLIAAEKGPYGNSYDQWRNDNLTNRYQGVQFGYVSAGRYTDWEDIWSYDIYKDRGILPGDYKYQDWNGDGEINGQDQHPFAYDQTPWLNFSLGLDANYKDFDLSLLFQGSALGSMQYQEPLYSIWGSNGGGALEQYQDRWHPVDPIADPYDPETEWVSGYYGYTGNYPFGNSDFNRVSTDYLRLKSIEVGYTLKPSNNPSTRIRFFANAYNLLTFTGVKFVDPEHPGDELGRMYPLTKTYTVGVTASF
ncbi:TonB-dependent receptor [Algoriphagus aquimarinus]|uniref:SusC/RagA family TonB-linked outer membrane protein n=1 Tax=Algoriphagus aquimarinus TaxID=237018 RepID=UPI0030D7EB14|tara:strand:+ start:136298 stop:139528 length:3231 start_codon:yes stop_codon:yes gene_type:complete